MTEQKVEQIEYELKDFYITAFLLASGAQLVKITRDTASNKLIFKIGASFDCDTLIKEYYNDKALVNPKAMKMKIQDLKSIIHQDSLKPTPPGVSPK